MKHLETPEQYLPRSKDLLCHPIRFVMQFYECLLWGLTFVAMMDKARICIPGILELWSQVFLKRHIRSCFFTVCEKQRTLHLSSAFGSSSIVFPKSSLNALDRQVDPSYLCRSSTLLVSYQISKGTKTPVLFSKTLSYCSTEASLTREYIG